MGSTSNKFTAALKSAYAGGYKSRQSRPLALIIKLVALIAILVLCTGISMLFRYFGAHESNFVMVYLLGILLYSFLTGSYMYSLAASLLGVLSYNFFFTEPYFTLQAYSPDYPMTFLIMFFVGCFTSMLTIRVRRETLLAEERAARIKALYQTGRNLLGVKSSANLAEISARELAAQLSADVMVQFFDSSGKIRYMSVSGKDVFSDNKEQLACRKSCELGVPCGAGTRLFGDARAYYLPVVSLSGLIGAVGIAPVKAAQPTQAQIEFLDTISTQIAVVLERETLYQKQEETKIQMQSERLRADMLRTISHDLRTPLTGIMGSASTVIDNYDSVGDDIKKSFLQNIYDDAGWLNDLVENILNMTRFEDGRPKLNIEQEAAEDIIAEAVGHVKKRATGHLIVSKIPPELILFEVDGVLITQVLVNLLDNAVNYTPEGSEITILLSRSGKEVIFEVRDDGPGIPEEELAHIFERFYTHKGGTGATRHGFGLGLTLCKSIIEAHGGKMYVKNAEPHGTSVIFGIPVKEGFYDEAADSDC